MSKNGGSLGESGCVSWVFEKKGEILIDKLSIDEESFLEVAIDLNIEDIDLDSPDYYSILIPAEDFDHISKSLEDKEIKIDGSVSLVPSNTVKVSGTEASQLLKLLDILENHEDIQKVYSNFDIDDNDLSDVK